MIQKHLRWFSSVCVCAARTISVSAQMVVVAYSLACLLALWGTSEQRERPLIARPLARLEIERQMDEFESMRASRTLRNPPLAAQFQCSTRVISLAVFARKQTRAPNLFSLRNNQNARIYLCARARARSNDSVDWQLNPNLHIQLANTHTRVQVCPFCSFVAVIGRA